MSDLDATPSGNGAAPDPSPSPAAVEARAISAG